MKIILASDVASGKVVLPSELAHLAKVPFVVASQRRVKGVMTWYVEMGHAWVKGATAAKVRVKAATKRVKELQGDVVKLTEQLKAADEYIAAQALANASLMKNLELPPKGPAPRSPPNYFDAAEKRGFQPKGRPLQGGLPGLGKG